MTLRVVIVDDEPLALSLLSAILGDVDDVEIVAICQEGREAVEAVLTHEPDILFLDIHMPEMNGFDVIAAIQSDQMPLVIFTTAYAEYAVEAFKVQALDYVLKPLADQAIMDSLERARVTLETRVVSARKPDLLTALHDISRQVRSESKPEKDDVSRAEVGTLIVKDSDRISFLNKAKIEWLEAAGDYVCIHIEGTTRLIRSTLKALEAELDMKIFIRIHRSTIINTTMLKHIVPASKGEAYAIMQDGNRLKVSRSFGAALRSKLT